MRRNPTTQGFSLVEVVIAIAVVAVTFIGLIGLLGVGLVSDQTSTEQTVATNIAASILADLRSTPNSASTPKSIRYSIPLSAAAAPSSVATPLASLTPSYVYFDISPNALNATPFASIPAAPPAGSTFLAAVYVTKLATAPQPTYMVRCLVTWPAQGTPSGNVDVITQFLSH